MKKILIKILTSILRKLGMEVVMKREEVEARLKVIFEKHGEKAALIEARRVAREYGERCGVCVMVSAMILEDEKEMEALKTELAQKN